jgi:hypothetical protein
VTSRRALALAVGVALLAAAVVLAVLAVQTWRWPAAAAREDRLLERARVPSSAWAGGWRGPAPALLGAADDVAYRRAVALFLRGRPDAPGETKTTDQIVAGIEAAIALAAIQRGDGPSARRSQAANLQAILVAEDALFEPDGAPRIRRAADLFRRAIRLDERNTAAKANLELLLSMTGRGGVDAESMGGFGGFGEESGAGAGGSGY